LREALAAARAIRNEDNRAEALRDLAPHLPEPLLREALAAAREIGDAEHRAEALAGLAPRLAEWARQERAAVHAAWVLALHALAARTRKDLFSDLRALSPVIATLGGAAAVAETFHAIQEVGRWWP
jgi:hypothetical protein